MSDGGKERETKIEKEGGGRDGREWNEREGEREGEIGESGTEREGGRLGAGEERESSLLDVHRVTKTNYSQQQQKQRSFLIKTLSRTRSLSLPFLSLSL